MTRSRALSLTALAINHFVDDDTDRGAKVGTQAVEMAARLKSPRTLERLQPCATKRTGTTTTPTRGV